MRIEAGPGPILRRWLPFEIAEELIKSEKTYRSDLESTSAGVAGAAAAAGGALDAGALLNGFPALVALSDRLITSLQTAFGQPTHVPATPDSAPGPDSAREEEQGYGSAFLSHMDSFTSVYGGFWETNEDALRLLARVHTRTSRL